MQKRRMSTGRVFWCRCDLDDDDAQKVLMAKVTMKMVRREEATSLTIAKVAVEVCAVEVEERPRYLPEVK